MAPPPRRRPVSMDPEPIMGISMKDIQGIDDGDPEEVMVLGTAMALVYIYDSIPDPPVSPAAPLDSITASRARLMVSTVSAASPTRSYGTSSLTSLPRMPHAPPSSPRVGVASGAPCPSP
ncbi:hypothetical protein PR202_gb17010 [Eleusine coracana subsp. coracana]|uniref:Uncharacterized protein n=1 Tax=Eleusine coracana subsp. coracana TaxID=191504 RepID=A0AAV5F2Z2_ELECO|nr:hypothetical protein PR202_gb17010 [Eleusine coracana subsp. coracana]